MITLDVAEGDPRRLAEVRTTLGEPYRTPLGHVRHEVGHWYWAWRIGATPAIEQFRGVVRRRAAPVRPVARGALLHRRRRLVAGAAPVALRVGASVGGLRRIVRPRVTPPRHARDGRRVRHGRRTRARRRGCALCGVGEAERRAQRVEPGDGHRRSLPVRRQRRPWRRSAGSQISSTADADERSGISSRISCRRGTSSVTLSMASSALSLTFPAVSFALPAASSTLPSRLQIVVVGQIARCLLQPAGDLVARTAHGVTSCPVSWCRGVGREPYPRLHARKPVSGCDATRRC